MKVCPLYLRGVHANRFIESPGVFKWLSSTWKGRTWINICLSDAGAAQDVPTDGSDLKPNCDRSERRPDIRTVPLSAFWARVIILTVRGGHRWTMDLAWWNPNQIRSNLVRRIPIQWDNRGDSNLLSSYCSNDHDFYHFTRWDSIQTTFFLFCLDSRARNVTEDAHTDRTKIIADTWQSRRYTKITNRKAMRVTRLWYRADRFNLKFKKLHI